MTAPLDATYAAEQRVAGTNVTDATFTTDPAAARDHLLADGPRHEVVAADVGGEHGVERRGVHLVPRAERVDGGVVDEDVGAAERGLGGPPRRPRSRRDRRRRRRPRSPHRPPRRSPARCPRSSSGCSPAATTRAPRSASSRAVARPMPVAAPVTIAVLPSTDIRPAARTDGAGERVARRVLEDRLVADAAVDEVGDELDTVGLELRARGRRRRRPEARSAAVRAELLPNAVGSITASVRLPAWNSRRASRPSA